MDLLDSEQTILQEYQVSLCDSIQSYSDLTREHQLSVSFTYIYFKITIDFQLHARKWAAQFDACAYIRSNLKRNDFLERRRSSAYSEDLRIIVWPSEALGHSREAIADLAITVKRILSPFATTGDVSNSFSLQTGLKMNPCRIKYLVLGGS